MEYASRSQLAELDRQLERGSLFTQATLQRGFQRIDEAEMLLVSLVRALATKGLISEAELGVRLSESPAGEPPLDPEPEPEMERDDDPRETQPSITWPSLALRVDPDGPAEKPEVLVDCEARMPVCQAICCHLKFPLTVQEVDAGNVKWDIGHPYIIRHESNGWCTHNADGTRGCEIYDERPGVCRKYSCYGDGRIWSDFDNMVLNHEWLDHNLGGDDLHVSAAPPAMDTVIVQNSFQE